MTVKCPVCGETAPEPTSLCMLRLTGFGEANQPCDYSREGEQRLAGEMGEDAPSTPNDEAGFMPASQPSTSNDE